MACAMTTAVGKRTCHWLTQLTVCLLISLKDATTLNQSYEEFVKETLREMCPYSTFCTHGPELQLYNSTTESCCAFCSCEKDCHTRGLCCPDFQGQTAESRLPQPICRVPYITNNEAYSRNIKHYNAYYVTNSCPSGYSDTSVRQRCQSPALTSLEQMNDVVAVSHGEKIYSNRHCALCNNVTTYTTWIPMYYQKKRDNTEAHLDSLADQYLIASVPVNEEELTKSKCFNALEEIERCNATGRQRYYNESLAKACNEIKLPYMDTNLEGRYSYKNPFCYLCNKFAFSAISKQCFRQGSELPVKESGGSLSVLLNTALQDSMQENDISSTCHPDEILDVHLKKCQRLHCPIFSIPYNGRCIPKYIQISGYHVTVLYHLTQNDTVSLAEIRGAEVSRKLTLSIQDFVRLKDLGCLQCEDWLMTRQKQGQTDISMLVTYITYNTCTLQTILDIHREIWSAGGEIISEIKGRNVSFGIQLNFDFSSVDSLLAKIDSWSDVKRISYDDAAQCSFDYMMQDRFCEYVELNVSEYLALKRVSNPSILNKYFRALYNETANHFIYRICLQDYSFIANKSPNDFLYTSPNAMVFAVVTFYAIGK